MALLYLLNKVFLHSPDFIIVNSLARRIENPTG